MEKAYERIKWENYPSVLTPLNETNLNKMDSALDEVDNRILGLDTAKVDKSIVNTMVKDVSFDETTGVFTVTLLDGTTKELDTKLEKIATNFRFDYESQKLILTLSDGSEQEIDLSSLISQYEFTDGDIISFTVDSDGKVSAIVKDGSITEEKLQPNFLADVKVEVEKAKGLSDSSYENASIASTSAQQAKQYRDETEQFRNEVEAVVNVDIATNEKAGLVKPDGTTIRVDEDGTIHADNGTVDYNELENKPSINGMELSGDKSLAEFGIASVEALEETNSKVNIIIEKAELNIKNNASGENLHLTDSANGKNVGFGLYGKAEQKQYSGKNLIPYPYYETTLTRNGITFTDNGDGTVTVNGTASATTSFICNHRIDNEMILGAGKYIASGCPKNGSTTTYRLVVARTSATTGGFELIARDYGDGVAFELTEETDVYIGCEIVSGVTVTNLTFKPMVRLASITDDTYEPYVGGIPSPNPDYPQEITVYGSYGSVEVKSCGKNLLKNLASSHVYNGITFTVNDDGSVTANGTSTGDIWVNLTGANSVKLDLDGNYILSGCPIGGSVSKYALTAVDRGTDDAKDVSVYRDEGKGVNVLFDSTHYYKIFIRVYSGATLNNLTFYPMIRLASDTDSTYEPYTETSSTIPTPNGLCGIKVSNGGNYTDENGQQWICDEVVKYADGSGKRIQRIAKAVFDGSEGWKLSETNNFAYLSSAMAECGVKEGIKAKLLSNYAYAQTYGNMLLAKVDYGVGFSSIGSVILRIKGCTTLEDYLAYLSNTPLQIVAEITTEPIITDLTAEEIAEIEKLHTFYPVTNISNDAECGMSITYMADAKNYIDNRLALIESAMLNNI